MLCNGGLGDTLISLGVADALARKVGQQVRFWTPHPDASELFLDNWVKPSPMHAGPNVVVDRSPFPGFDFFIRINCIAVLEFERTFKGFPFPGMDEVNLDNAAFREGPAWSRFLRFHPQLDGEVARSALERGWTRWTLPYRMLGLEPPTTAYTIALDAPRYDWTPFITVHDGYDTTQRPVHRATKTWNLRSWASAIEYLKIRHPEIMVVQIGSKNSRAIPGVDVNLVGQTLITEALSILSASKLHLDGDSGLVHAARHLGVPCIALFGPTPIRFFGYPEHFNFSAGDCQACFWLDETWLEKCVLGKPAPSCMDAIDVHRVVDRALRILDGHPRPLSKSGDEPQGAVAGLSGKGPLS